MTSAPTVTIVVATHAGRAHLARCLPALAALDYPGDRYQTIVVDDASTDGSAAFVAEQYPGVQLIRSERNLGFAGATNRGFAAASSDFVVALNDDTAVTSSWLAELVRPAFDDPSVGLCTGKLILMDDRLRVSLRRLDQRVASLSLPHAVWRDGEAVSVERLGFPNPTYRELGVPVPPGHCPDQLRLALAEEPGTLFDVSIGESATQRVTVPPDGTLTLSVPSDAICRSVVQNAGSMVFRDGRGRDRGAVTGPGYHYYQDDVGQFDRTEEVFAGCGASLLVRSATLADVGAFDERFFTYYEDVDLSWRARLRGWRIVYAARAVARHAHRGTTAQWSAAFVYYTERNRLMLLLKLAPGERALAEIGRAVLRAGWASLAAARRRARGLDGRGAWAGPRWAALAGLARQLPGLLASRALIQARRQVPQADVDRWLEDDL